MKSGEEEARSMSQEEEARSMSQEKDQEV